MKYDQILCWRRATRWTVINYLRTVLGRPPGRPVEGDRIICLANNKTLQIFNGQAFTVTDVKPSPNDYDDEVLLHLEDEMGVRRVIDGYLAGFEGLKAEKAAESKRLGAVNDTTGLFTFANALTVHKAQGSQWSSVLIMDETSPLIAMNCKMGASHEEAVTAARRWLYTAVTRAEKTVTIHRMRRR
jgi:exodeoxyribonuclease V